MVAAFEVCSNIIEHAAASLPVHLHIELRLMPTYVEVAFTDDGEAAQIDLDSVALPTDDLADRGRGLPIAKAALDDLNYQRLDGLNHWWLRHRLDD